LERRACRVLVGKPERGLDVDGRIIIRRNVRKYEEKVWIGFI
jgi:hypothetical protein